MRVTRRHYCLLLIFVTAMLEINLGEDRVGDNNTTLVPSGILTDVMDTNTTLTTTEDSVSQFLNITVSDQNSTPSSNLTAVTEESGKKRRRRPRPDRAERRKRRREQKKAGKDIVQAIEKHHKYSKANNQHPVSQVTPTFNKTLAGVAPLHLAAGYGHPKPDDIQVGCKELRSKRYISDGFCTSVKPITEVVCAGHCLPIRNLPWYAEYVKVWARTKVLEWRCVDDEIRRKRVELQCENGETRTYRIKVVRSCKCKRYTKHQNQSFVRLRHSGKKSYAKKRHKNGDL